MCLTCEVEGYSESWSDSPERHVKRKNYQRLKIDYVYLCCTKQWDRGKKSMKIYSNYRDYAYLLNVWLNRVTNY